MGTKLDLNGHRRRSTNAAGDRTWLDDAITEAFNDLHPLAYVEDVTFRSCLQERQDLPRRLVDAFQQDPTLIFLKASIMKTFGEFLEDAYDKNRGRNTFSELMGHTSVCSDFVRHLQQFARIPTDVVGALDDSVDTDLMQYTLLNTYLRKQTPDMDPEDAPSLRQMARASASFQYYPCEASDRGWKRKRKRQWKQRY